MRSRIWTPLFCLALLAATFLLTVLGAPRPASVAEVPTEGPPLAIVVPTEGPTATPQPQPEATAAPVASPTPASTPTEVWGPSDGRPTRIVAPAIGLDSPVVEVGYNIVVIDGVETTGWIVPRNVAGFHKGSAYPGTGGNTVISGHHNVGREVFRYVVDLKIGDEVILYAGAREYHYRVEQTMTLPEKGMTLEQRQENARWIMSTDDERLTLVTCWPYSSNTHRVIVVARPIR